MIDDEGNEFPIGLMVVEGEYLTLDGKSRRTSGHVFVDYRPGFVVYHFTNLIVGMNIHLQTMSNKNLTKVRYFLPHLEHERLMEAIIRGNLGYKMGLIRKRTNNKFCELEFRNQ